MMRHLVTVGVYGFTAERFLATLERAGVDVLLDVRQRRGVRGSEYAWANSQRLQAALDEAGIAYEHHPELAPEYRTRYIAEILDQADLEAVAASLPESGAGALFCVERDPEACHRSLVAERLEAEHGVAVKHLRP